MQTYEETVKEILKGPRSETIIKRLKRAALVLLNELEEFNLVNREYTTMTFRIKLRALAKEIPIMCDRTIPVKVKNSLDFVYNCQAILTGQAPDEEEENEP